jgi:hypothetical protein
MVPKRRDWLTNLGFHCLRIQYLYSQTLETLVRVIVRRKPLLVYSQFTVYGFPRNNQSLPLVKDAIDLFLAKSPFLARREHLFKSIMLSERLKLPCDYGAIDRCCLLNPLFPVQYASDADSARVIMASLLAGATMANMVYQGRFGYVGLRNIVLMINIAQVRFLRKCLTKENRVDVLGGMATCSEFADKHRPNRSYSRLVMERDVNRWRGE